MNDALANPEAEAALLGAIMRDNSLLERLPVRLEHDDFAEPFYAGVFARVLALRSRDQQANPVTLRRFFAPEECAVLARLTGDLMGDLAPGANAEMVAELAERRRRLEWLKAAQAACFDLSQPLVDLPPPADSQRIAMGLPIIDLSRWQGSPPKRLSFWGDWLPANQTTMLTGRGGIGKSLFEQCLCTAIALGRPFLGMATVQRNVLYVTCEDDEAELWRRQDAVNEAFCIERADLAGKLFLCSLMGETDTALATFDPSGRISVTPRWGQIERACETHGIAIFAFDNATDAMAGDLNDLHQVAEFVNLLTGLAKRLGGAAMIIHHPNKGGDDWLGSVAWHNKVRSRLIIEDGGEGDPDARIIRNPKANYGAQGGRIAFRWHSGAFVRDEDLGPDRAAQLRELSTSNAQCDAFLACLRQRASEGIERAVGPNSGPNYAPSQFEGMPEANGFDRRALRGAMDRLFRMNRITTVEVERPGKSSRKTIIVEAPDHSPNAFPNASRSHFPNAPERRPNSPAHTPLSYRERAGPDGPPPSDEVEGLAERGGDA